MEHVFEYLLKLLSDKFEKVFFASTFLNKMAVFVVVHKSL